MALGITALIREYVGVPETTIESESQIKEIDRCISGFFTQWSQVILVEHITLGFSHNRYVYIIADFNPLEIKRWVIKINNFVTRSAQFATKSFSNRFPTTEEVAYQICKVIEWNVIPKTKVLYQTEISHSKYCHLLQPFLENHRIPCTFTVQKYVPGATLPFSRETEKWKLWHDANPKISLDSYQKCYLLDLILGLRDARGDNIIHNPQTGEFFEIDNESLGGNGYSSIGPLNNFPRLKNAPISKAILEDILKVKPEQIAELQKKYVERDKVLFNIWNGELLDKRVKRCSEIVDIPRCIPAMIQDLGSSRPIQWRAIYTHLHAMQQTIQSLMSGGEEVTVNKIEAGIKTHR